MHPKVVILGSGPAGLTAAIYAAQAKLETLVIRNPQYSGVSPTNQAGNYSRSPEGGGEHYERLELQAERFGAQFMDTLVQQVDLSQRPFSLTTDFGEVIKADSLIIATGASPGVPGEGNFLNQDIAGVFAAGDVTDPLYQQTITDAGQGTVAALEATWFLAEQEYLSRKSQQTVSLDQAEVYAAEIGLAAR